MNILHTTSEQVRAALGVTDKEISDQQLTDLNLSIQLEVELGEVYPDHVVAVAAGQAGGATAAEVRTYQIITLYCQYQCAAFVLPAFQNFAYQKISDGGVEYQRFSKDNIEDTRKEILGMRDKYKALLSEELSGAGESPLSVMVAVTPSFNPVTNEGAEA